MTRIAAPLKTGASSPVDLDELVACEWLITNGLGGYASGTVAGVITRGFHGYLIAALPSPFGRVVMLNDLVEQLVLPGERIFQLGGEERVGEPLRVHGASYLVDFHLDSGLPVWLFEVEGYKLEKRLLMPHGQNSTFVHYKLLEGSETVKLQLRPFDQHAIAGSTGGYADYFVLYADGRRRLLRSFEFERLAAAAAQDDWIEHRINSGTAANPASALSHRREAGVSGTRRSLVTGVFLCRDSERPDRNADCFLRIVGHNSGTQPGRSMGCGISSPQQAGFRSGPASSPRIGTAACFRADQFRITPAGRIEEAVKARAAGDEVRTVIAGYHWFTDWGRDTMISLEGLTLTTGRYIEASYILRTFARYIRNGLIPNMFPEGKNTGLYHTADATLWFFHAIDRFVD